MLKSLLSLFIRFPCPLCQRPAEVTICLDCQRQLESCQLSNPSRLWRGHLPVFAWGTYEGKLKRAIAALKYDLQPEIGITLGRWLADAWVDAAVSKQQKLTVVPIPLAASRLKTRGFNQAEAIARGFCQGTGYSLQPQALVRVKETQAMFGLSPAQRQQNLDQAFKLSTSWQQQRSRSSVLLVDDIYTTGTTVRQAARILHQHQIRVLGVVVAAQVTRHR